MCQAMMPFQQGILLPEDSSISEHSSLFPIPGYTASPDWAAAAWHNTSRGQGPVYDNDQGGFNAYTPSVHVWRASGSVARKGGGLRPEQAPVPSGAYPEQSAWSSHPSTPSRAPANGRSSPSRGVDTGHVIWGKIEHESQDSLLSMGTSQNADTPHASYSHSGSRKKVQNRKFARGDILFLDSQGSYSSGSIEEEKEIALQSGALSGQGYTFSAQAFKREVAARPPSPCEEASDKESDCSSQGLAAQQKEQQARQWAWEAGGIDVEALLAQVPLGEDGEPMSIGSIGHATGDCQAACAFAQRARGCANGMKCNFCHFSHKVKRQRQRHKVRPRPCKGKRDKYRKHWEDLKNQVEENPAGFDPDTVELPASISTYDRLRAKLVTRLKTHKTNVMAERSQEPC